MEHRLRWAVLLVIGLVFTLGGHASGPAAAQPEAPSAISISPLPAAANLFTGGLEVVFDQIVATVPASQQVGSFEIGLRFDPSFVDVSLTEGPLLGSTGRSTSCSTLLLGENELRLHCSSAGDNDGPTGSGVLATIVVRQKPDVLLRPTSENGTLLVLDSLLPQTRLDDIQGKPIALGWTYDALVTVRALEGDFNQDCRVGVSDVQAVAGRYPSSLGDPAYDPFYDVEPNSADGDIDLVDLQFVLGRLDSTCDQPIPAQPPRTVDPDDPDDDDVVGLLDNCPHAFNPDQANSDALPIDNPNVSGGLDITVPNEDNLGDACDSDDDNDGYDDGDEAAACTGPTEPKVADTDGDGVVDRLECLLSGGDPLDPDRKPYMNQPDDGDGDGLPSSVEAVFGCSDSNPDTDGDGFRDSTEVKGWGTSCHDIDTDGDGINDCVEIASIDGDEAATVLDVMFIARAAVGLDSPHAGLDIDKDGGTTILDVQRGAQVALVPGFCPM